jgi:tetratricopeptide (TPR) repeat protein
MNIFRGAARFSRPRLGKQVLVSLMSLALLFATWPKNLPAYQNAQTPAQAPAQGAQAAPYTQQTPEQLQRLVAPIALYPDSLVAQILAASTFPEQVVEADRWVQAHPDLKGDALGQAVDQQPWDPSVKALAAFPSVLGNMDKNLSWTSSLGDAYYNQEQDVMDPIQVMRARDALNKGVVAFKEAQFDKATEYFKQAKELDPDLINARLYLATAYASQYIPGAPSDENLNHGKEAIAEYESVLEKDPNNLNAIDGLASILYQMAGQPFDPKKFELSKEYNEKHIQLKPQDATPYYFIGVIDWALAFRGNTEMREDYNKAHINKQVKYTDPLPPDVRKAYTDKYASMVDDGIASLKKAIELKPDYEDAMTYLNLLYRRKADMVESTAERDALNKQADELLDKVKEIKQKKAEQPQ